MEYMMNEIEIFGQCALCDEWRDLEPWKKGVSLCQGCTWYADLHAPHIRGKHKVDNATALTLMKEQFLKKKGQANG